MTRFFPAYLSKTRLRLSAPNGSAWVAAQCVTIHYTQKRLPGCGRRFPISRSQMLCRMLAHWKYIGDLLWHPLLHFPVRSSATSFVRLKHRALEVQLSPHLDMKQRSATSSSASAAIDGGCRDCVHGGWLAASYSSIEATSSQHRPFAKMAAILRQCLLPTMCSSIWLVVLSRAHGLRSKDGGTRRVLPTSVGSRAAGSCPGPAVCTRRHKTRQSFSCGT